MTNPYQFWQDSLAGLKPPIINEFPQPGFFRMKRGKNGPWVPVAVWPLSGTRIIEPGLGFKFGKETVGKDFGIEQWPYYAANPITEAEYRKVAERGESWSDSDPVVAELTKLLSHGVPPVSNPSNECLSGSSIVGACRNSCRKDHDQQRPRTACPVNCEPGHRGTCEPCRRHSYVDHLHPPASCHGSDQAVVLRTISACSTVTSS